MATKLKNLKVTKVDFVDEGANPDAHIRLYKRKDGVPEQEVPENQPIASKQNVWHKMFGAIAKAAGLKQEEADNMVNMIEKSGAESFGSMMNQRKTRRLPMKSGTVVMHCILPCVQSCGMKSWIICPLLRL